MAKVWVVTEGEYSDYQVFLAVFSEDRREDAERAASLTKGHVEEYELNPAGYVDPGMDHFGVSMDDKGKCRVDSCPRRVESDGQPFPSRARIREVLRGHCGWLSWAGYARSSEEAVRQANEIRRQVLAGQIPPGVEVKKD